MDAHLESVHARGKDGRGTGALVVLEELAGRDGGVPIGESPYPGGRKLAAASIDGVTALGREDPRVDAEVLA